MKIKFILLTTLLLFSRGCDFYSTSLFIFQENGLDGEMNPLTRLFGVGWNGLIIANVIVVSLVIGLLFYYLFRYRRTDNYPVKPANFKEFVSLQYYDDLNSFYRIFYRSPKNKRAFYAHTGFVLTITVIVGSFLATFHNICQFYGYDFYDRYREIVGRPLYVIYFLIFLTFAITHHYLLKAEYQRYKQSVEHTVP